MESIVEKLKKQLSEVCAKNRWRLEITTLHTLPLDGCEWHETYKIGSLDKAAPPQELLVKNVIENALQTQGIEIVVYRLGCSCTTHCYHIGFINRGLSTKKK